MDWCAIKAEYITDASSSYRRLAAKFNIPINTLTTKAVSEGWSNEKKQYQKNLVAKTLDKFAEKESDRAVRLLSVSDKLLAKIEKTVDEADELPPSIIESLARSLKSLKDVQMIKSGLDVREQEARIRALEKQVEKTEETPTIMVTFEKNEDFSE